LKLPLILLIHDLPDVFDQVYGWAAQRQQAKNARVYNYAARRISVSPEMRDHLAERYNAGGDFLYPNRSDDLEPRSLDEAQTLKQPGTLTIGYAGALGFGRGYVLNDMAQSLRDAGAQLRIYSKDAWEGVDPQVIKHCGYAPPTETWAKVKSDCDAVILPYHWPSSEGSYKELYHTSFPSKLPEYTALGMPILIAGPKETLGVKWGLNHPQASLVVTENEPAAWTAALVRLKESAQLRESLSRHAVLAGARDFDPLMIRERFLAHLKEVSL
jgi:glycosyltransferase involved in cell wall biosynthesis